MPLPALSGFCFRRWSALIVLLGLALGGCECGDGGGISNSSARLVVEPAELTLEGVPRRATDGVLRVQNQGRSPLTLTDLPTVEEHDGDGATEFALLGVLNRRCDDSDRPAATRLVLEPGECTFVTVRYAPSTDGQDEATVHFVTNDLESPTVDVPVHGRASTPDVEVCAFDGETAVGCNAPGVPFEVNFGVSAPGTRVSRRFVIRSAGSKPLRLSDLTQTGDDDFSASPLTVGQTLEPGQSVSFEAVFDARSGGPREAQLRLPTNDPDEDPVTIRLVAQGDAPRLCFCVGSATERCVSSPQVRFGEVPVSGTAEKFIRFASCGSKPVTLKRVEVTSGGPVFEVSAPNLAGGRVLAPGETLPDMPIRFRPPSVDRFTGRLTVESGTENGFISLDGSGVDSGCRLEPSATTLDFGQAVVGAPSRREWAVSNRGSAPCFLAGAPTISQGAGARFAVVGTPPGPEVPPGGTVRFSISYDPADLAGPDTGELLLRYGVTAAATTTEIRVPLLGTPTQQARCVLVAQPNTGSQFGRTLNFGQVRVRQRKELPVTFLNTGSTECRITGARIAAGLGADASVFEISRRPTFPLSVQPGQTIALDVAFTPVSDTDYGSPLGGGFPVPGTGVTLAVNTTDTQSFNGQGCGSGLNPNGPAGCVAWKLSGKGVQSDLRVLPSDVDFGLVTLGCRSREQAVTLYNTGTVPIEIRSLRVEPAPPPEIFRVQAPPLPLTLRGGQQASISVRYRPPDTNIHTGSIFIESNASNVSASNPYVTVGLRGQGTTEGHQTDTFEQSAQAKSDVLFVLDDSGSMSEEQGELASNAQRFLQVASQLNTDYHVAVVSTDMESGRKAGLFQGSPKIVTPGPNASADLSRTVRSLGTNGSADEKGLAAMVAALSEPLISDPAKNAGFLRPDARLAVVMVSDEEDGSSGTLDFYTDFLRNIKGAANASLVSFSAIVGDAPGGCSSSNGQADAGDRYVELQRRTGGKFRSICSQNWGQIAADIGLDAFAARAGFPLSRDADPSTIRVQVNGVAAPTSNWSYDAASNTVVFGATSTPPAGARVVIDYDTACL